MFSQFKCQKVLFDIKIGPYQALPLQARSDGNEEVLWIPQSSSVTWASPLDGLMSYLGNSCKTGGCLPLYRDAASLSYTPTLASSSIFWVFSMTQLGIKTLSISKHFNYYAIEILKRECDNLWINLILIICYWCFSSGRSWRF